MKNLYFLTIAICFCSNELFSQSTCNNPVQVDICPGIYLANQTNAGMGDDMPNTCNIPGQDVVYEISAPNGADNIFVSIVNASAPLILVLTNTTCTNSACSSQIVGSGNTNVVFPVASFTSYYLWIDAASIITYGISIAGDTGITWVNIPNTRGNLKLDGSGCASPMFQNTKPYFQVSYNNVFKTNPMTLSPLNVPGTMCVTTFFSNTSGIEAVKRFEFYFNPLGYSITSAPSFVPGNYLPGSWVSTQVGNKWIFDFIDNAGTNRGDFSGTPNSCLNYTFCFTVTPINNIPAYTNVEATIFSDGRGAGFSGNVRSGCCPILNPNCGGPPGNGGPGTGGSFAFTFNDPANPLPVKLLDFRAKYIKHKVHLTWTTASETNNNFFTVEKSQDAFEWTEVNRLEGAGNSTIIHSYQMDDLSPFKGSSYYRLKQTDFDGNSEYFNIVKVNEDLRFEVKIYPNPASENIYIESNDIDNLSCKIFNLLGEDISFPFTIENNLENINTSELSPGVYFLFILQGDDVIKKEKIILRNN